MKLLEVIFATLLLGIILVLWANQMLLSSTKIEDVEKKIQQDAEKINMYNFIQIFQKNATFTGSTFTWFVVFSWQNYVISNIISPGSGNHYMECSKSTWNMILINNNFTWVFCSISIDEQKIYNYQLTN